MFWWLLVCVPNSARFLVLSIGSLLFSITELLTNWYQPDKSEKKHSFPSVISKFYSSQQVYKFSNSLHKELQYKRKSDLSWKWVRCRSNRSKIILLKWEFFEKLAHFFGLVLVCSFSILSRWFLTLTNELIYIYLHVSKCFPETKNNPSNKTIYNILIIISPDV